MQHKYSKPQTGDTSKIDNAFFIVTLNDERLYAGKIFSKFSRERGLYWVKDPFRYDFPVLYFPDELLSKEKKSKADIQNITLRFSPSASWMYRGMLTSNDEKKFKRTRHEEVYNFFLVQKKLQGHGFNAETIELADKIKALRTEKKALGLTKTEDVKRQQQVESELGPLLDTFRENLNLVIPYGYSHPGLTVQRIITLIGEPDIIINQSGKACIGPPYVCDTLKVKNGETFLFYRWRGKGFNDMDGKLLTAVYFKFNKQRLYEKGNWIGFDAEMQTFSKEFKTTRDYLKEN